MLEDVRVVLLEVIIVLVFTILFFQIVSSPECNQAAFDSANNIATAVNRVGQDDFPMWYGDGIPPDDEIDYYYPAKITMCEETIKFFGTGAAWHADVPTYQIVYEHFPESGTFSIWDESYPWSGGAGSAALMYGAIRYGPKILLGPVTLVKKIAVGTVKIPVRIIKVITWLRKRFAIIGNMLSRSNKYSISDDLAAQLGDARLFRSKYRKAIFEVKTLSIGEAAAKTHKLEMDDLLKTKMIAGTFMDNGPHRGKLFVNPDSYVEVKGLFGRTTKVKASDLFRHARSLMSEADRKSFDQMFLIKKRWPAGAIQERWWKFKPGMKNKIYDKWWKTSRIRRGLGTIRDGVTRVKKTLRKVFWKESIPANNILEAREINRMMALNSEVFTETGESRPVRDLFKDYLRKNWDTDDGNNIKRAIRASTNRKIKTVDDVTDADMVRVFKNYEGKASQDFVSFAPQVNKRVHAYETAQDLLRSDMKLHSSTLARKAGDSPVDVANNFKGKWTKEWDDLSFVEKQDFVNDLNKGSKSVLKLDMNNPADEKILKAIRKDMKTSIESLPFGRNPNLVLNSRKIKKIERRFNSKRLNTLFRKVDSRDIMFSKFQPRQVTPTTLSKIASAVKSPMTKRYAWIKFGAHWSPLNPFGGRQNTRLAENLITDQCQGDSICLISALGADTYNFPLENTGYQVRLWREKPSVTERIPHPIFINTAWMHKSVKEHPRFYTVSPCFTFMKVWKGATMLEDGTPSTVVFVSMSERDDKTVVRGTVKNVSGTEYDTANYCYADYNYVWGKGKGAALVYTTDVGLALCAGACTFGPQAIAASECIRRCAIAGEIALSAEAEAATLSEKNAPATDSGMGYWDYYMMADACDFYDILESLGVRYSKKSGELAGDAVKKAEKHGMWAGDLCTLIEIMGDASLAWPVRSTFPVLPHPFEEGLQKNKPLNYEDMEKYLARLTVGK